MIALIDIVFMIDPHIHQLLVEGISRCFEAQQIMTENKIRHLPVVGDGKRLLGLITRRRLTLEPDTLSSLNVWEISRHLANLTAGKIMIPARI